jgi:hypothetical protein
MDTSMTDIHHQDSAQLSPDTDLDDTWLRDELAINILPWALIYMSEDELAGDSRALLLDRYINHHLRPTLDYIYPEIQAWAKYGPPIDDDDDDRGGASDQLDLWPYSERSGLIERGLARSIRAWALSRMSETELNSYSQRQLVHMYLHQHIGPTLKKVAPWIDLEACFADE